MCWIETAVWQRRSAGHQALSTARRQQQPLECRVYLLSGTRLHGHLAEHLTSMNFSRAVNCILSIDIIFNVQRWRTERCDRQSNRRIRQSGREARIGRTRRSQRFHRPYRTAATVAAALGPRPRSATLRAGEILTFRSARGYAVYYS